jgi:hypothetical protein
MLQRLARCPLDRCQGPLGPGTGPQPDLGFVLLSKEFLVKTLDSSAWFIYTHPLKTANNGLLRCLLNVLHSKVFLY